MTLLIKVKKYKKAQSTIEFLVLMTIILAAFLSIQVYFKRGVQGRWKANIDNMGDQYDPRVAVTDITYKTHGNTVTKISSQRVQGGIRTRREDIVESHQFKFGSSSVNY